MRKFNGEDAKPIDSAGCPRLQPGRRPPPRTSSRCCSALPSSGKPFEQLIGPNPAFNEILRLCPSRSTFRRLQGAEATSWRIRLHRIPAFLALGGTYAALSINGWSVVDLQADKEGHAAEHDKRYGEN